MHFHFGQQSGQAKEATPLHGRKFGANLAVKEGRAETHEQTLSQFSSKRVESARQLLNSERSVLCGNASGRAATE